MAVITDAVFRVLSESGAYDKAVKRVARAMAKDYPEHSIHALAKKYGMGVREVPNFIRLGGKDIERPGPRG